METFPRPGGPNGPTGHGNFQQMGGWFGHGDPSTLGNPFATQVSQNPLHTALLGQGQSPTTPMMNPDANPSISVGSYNQFYGSALPAYVRHFIVHATVKRSYPHFNILRPRLITGDKLSGLSYTILRFNNALPVETPEGTTPNMIHHTMESHYTRFTRKGQAFQMTLDHLNTPSGQELFRNYVANLASNSTLSAQLTITATILRCKDLYRTTRMKYGSSDGSDKSSLARIISTVGYLSNSDDAIYRLAEAVSQTVSATSMPPITHVLATPTLFPLLAYGSEKNSEYSRIGPESRQIIKQGGDYFEKGGVRGMTFVREPSYHIERSGQSGNAAQNLLTRRISVGRHYWMTRSNMISRDQNIPFSSTCDLGFLNYAKANGSVVVQKYESLLDSAACWDHNTGDLWKGYEYLVGNDGNGFKTVAREAGVKEPGNDKEGSTVDPWVVWLPNRSPRVTKYLCEQDTSYTSLADQALIVRKAYEKIASKFTHNQLECLQNTLVYADRWFTPDREYGDPFAFACANANDGRPFGNFELPRSYEGFLAVGTAVVARNTGIKNYNHLYDENQRVAGDLDPSQSCFAKLNKAFPDYVLVEVPDANSESSKYAGSLGIRAKKDCFPGFSTLEHLTILSEGMTNEDDLLSESCKKTITSGVAAIRTLMGFLHKTFSCRAAPNFFFDATRRENIGTRGTRGNDFTILGARLMLFGPRYEAIYASSVGGHSDTDHDELISGLEPLRRATDEVDRRAKFASWAARPGSSDTEEEPASGKNKVMIINANFDETFFKKRLFANEVSGMRIGERTDDPVEKLVYLANLLDAVPSLVSIGHNHWDQLSLETTQKISGPSSRRFTLLGSSVLKVFNEVIKRREDEFSSFGLGNNDAKEAALLLSVIISILIHPDDSEIYDGIGDGTFSPDDRIIEGAEKIYETYSGGHVIRDLEVANEDEESLSLHSRSSVKSGRLYLTRTKLCFSRNYYKQYSEAVKYEMRSASADEKGSIFGKNVLRTPEGFCILRPSTLSNPYANVDDANLSKFTIGNFSRIELMRVTQAPFLSQVLADSSSPGPDSDGSEDTSLDERVLEFQNESGLYDQPRKRKRDDTIHWYDRHPDEVHSQILGDLNPHFEDDYSRKAQDYFRGDTKHLSTLSETIRNLIGIGRAGTMNPEEVEMFNSPYVVDRITCCSNDRNTTDGIITWCVNLAYCGTRVHKYAFLAMKNENVPPPIGFLVVDLDVVVETAAVVFMALGGEPAGYLNYFIPDFSSSYDAQNKIVTYTLTFHTAGMIQQPNRFLTVPDAIFEGYISGGDGRHMKTGLRDLELDSQYNYHIHDEDADVHFNWRTGNHTGSRLVFHVGFSTDETKMSEHINHAGSILDPTYKLASWAPRSLINSDQRRSPMSYDSGLLACDRFGLHKMSNGNRGVPHDQMAYAFQTDIFASNNTLTSRGAQWEFCDSTKKYTLKASPGSGALALVSDIGSTKVMDGQITVESLQRMPRYGMVA